MGFFLAHFRLSHRDPSIALKPLQIQLLTSALSQMKANQAKQVRACAMRPRRLACLQHGRTGRLKSRARARANLTINHLPSHSLSFPRSNQRSCVVSCHANAPPPVARFRTGNHDSVPRAKVSLSAKCKCSNSNDHHHHDFMHVSSASLPARQYSQMPSSPTPCCFQPD